MSEPWRLGGGRGRVSPSLGACLEDLGFGGFETRWVHLHASRHKASADFAAPDADSVASDADSVRSDGVSSASGTDFAAF